MSRSVYLFGIFVTACFGWASWAVVLNKFSPYVSPAPAIFFFYASLFIALTATFALMGFYLRIILSREEVYLQQINIALRQGVWLALLFCVGLIFQHLQVLTWWDGVLMVLILILLEFYFMAKN